MADKEAGPIALEVKFWRTHNRPLLDRAGVTYGLLILEDGSFDMLVSSLNDWRYFLDGIQNDNIPVTTTTIDRISRELQVLQVLSNFAEVAKRVATVHVPRGTDSGKIIFYMCNHPGCKCRYPHGFFHDHSKYISDQIMTVRACMEIAESLAADGLLSVDEAIALAQECSRHGLYLDEIEMAEHGIEQLESSDCCPVATESLLEEARFNLFTDGEGHALVSVNDEQVIN